METGAPLVNTPLTSTWSGADTGNVSPVSATSAVVRLVASTEDTSANLPSTSVSAASVCPTGICESASNLDPWRNRYNALQSNDFREKEGAHCLIKNVTGELTVRSGAAIPNRIGVADGRTDQHGCAARDHGSGGRPLSISRAGR